MSHRSARTGRSSHWLGKASVGASALLLLLATGCATPHKVYQPLPTPPPADMQVFSIEPVRQTDARGCGAAALEMVFHYWNKPVSQEAVIAAIDDGHKSGIEASKMKALCEEHGLRAVVVAGEPADLFKYLNRKIPLIVARKEKYPGGYGYHYMVAGGFSDGYRDIVFFDPARGPITARLADFLDEWAEAKNFLMIIVPQQASS